MNPRLSRSEWPGMVAGFLAGFLIALVLVGLWVMLSSASQESFDLTSGDPAQAEGLISYTYDNISRRLAEERRVVRPVRGDLTVRATNVVWRDPAGGRDFLRAGEVRGRVDTRAATRGDVVVRGLVLSDADVYVEQNAGEQWNYERVLSAGGENGSGPRADGAETTFLVTDAAIRNTDVAVNTPDTDFAIENVAAQLPRIVLSGPRVAAPEVSITRATGTLLVDDSAYAVSVDGARVEFPGGRVEFAAEVVTSGATRIANVSGSFGGDVPGIGLLASGRAENVRFEDIRFLSPRIPASGVASFNFRIRPFDAARTEVMLSAARIQTNGSNITGSATLRVGDQTMELAAVDARFDPLALSLVEQLIGDTLPYRGVVRGTARGTNGLISFDVNTLLTSADVSEPFATHLTGSARFSTAGFELRQLQADLRDTPLLALRAVIPGLPLSGTVTGRVMLSGPPNRAPLDLNVRLELAHGVVGIDGTLDLTGPVPAYNVSGRLIAVNLQELLEPDVPPVFLTGRFDAVGSGTDPRTANARIHVDGRFTGWRSGPRDTLHLALRLQNGTVQIDTAAVKLATMSGDARGTWRFVEPLSGSLEYRLAFEPITPFGPYFPFLGDEDASGNLRIAGTVSGGTGRVTMSGEGTGSNVLIGGWGADALQARYRLVLGPAVPEIDVAASARNLRTPTAGAYETATATVRLVSPTFALNVQATRATGGDLEIVADGRIPPTGGREVVLQRARIQLSEENWSLTGPAVFAWGGDDGVNVRDFEMQQTDGPGIVRVDGRVWPLANASFNVETVSVPIGDVQELLGQQPRVAGELTATADVRSSGGVPVINARFQLDAAVIENVGFSQVVGEAVYSGQTLRANATALVATAGQPQGQLQLNAELPLALSFDAMPSARMLDSGPVRITVVSDSITLAPFAALSPDVRDVAGRLAANLAVTGTVENPVLQGGIVVSNAAVTVLPLNQRYDDITAIIDLENRRAVIRELRARSDGYATASGAIEFRELNRPVLDITARLDNFRAIGVDDQEDASLTGELALTGPVGSATLTGNVEVEDGYIPIPQVGGSPFDTELARLNVPSTQPEPSDPEGQTDFYRGLTIDDVQVHVGENVWFAMEDARAQLTGDVTVNKTGTAVRIVGELEGNRGTYTLRAGPIIRRFDVVEANVRFLGTEELNPAIDITARRIVIDPSSRQLDIRVRVSGTLQNPSLSLASADAAFIPESELLSFLLFGQPTFALSGARSGAEQLLGETYLGGITELVSMELEQALLDELDLGFDIFQIKFGGLGLPGFGELSPSLVIGRELADDVFLTVESGVGTLFGGEQTTTPWAVRLEWRIDEHTTLRAGVEPVNIGRALRGLTVALPTIKPRQQATVELRRRWSW